MIIEVGRKYINKKNNKQYMILNKCLNVTENRDEPSVVYVEMDIDIRDMMYFVRSEEEFAEKFVLCVL